jgi:uncharacterized phage protein (TIGR02220 family)
MARGGTGCRRSAWRWPLCGRPIADLTWRWEGDPAVFIKALQDSGFLDGLQIHDWKLFARELIYQRLYNKTKRANTCKTAVTTPVLHPLPNPTLPNPTLPNHTKRKALSCKQDLDAPVLYLNEKTKKNFDPKNKATRRLLQARYNEGRTLDQLKTDIDTKVAEWFTDEKMVLDLRPSTLFNATNFENYLNQQGGKHEWDRECFRSSN